MGNYFFDRQYYGMRNYIMDKIIIKLARKKSVFISEYLTWSSAWVIASSCFSSLGSALQTDQFIIWVLDILIFMYIVYFFLSFHLY